METAMVLVGSSVLSGLLAIVLLALSHRAVSGHDYDLDDHSPSGLQRIMLHVSRIRLVRKGSGALLGFHRTGSLSHVEIHHKDGSIRRVHPRNGHEAEAVHKKFQSLRDRMLESGLPQIIHE